MTSIIELHTYSQEYHEATQRFLDQLTTNPMTLTDEMFKQLLESENSHVFFLHSDKQIAGMITIGIYHSPTGGKAWIEDVVVDKSFRGQGFGKLLITHAMEFVKSHNIPLLMLTSNPTRIAANALYQSIGFERKETNVYRMKF